MLNVQVECSWANILLASGRNELHTEYIIKLPLSAYAILPKCQCPLLQTHTQSNKNKSLANSTLDRSVIEAKNQSQILKPELLGSNSTSLYFLIFAVISQNISRCPQKSSCDYLNTTHRYIMKRFIIVMLSWKWHGNGLCVHHTMGTHSEIRDRNKRLL